MKLKEYQEKRNFKDTNEPIGQVGKRDGNRFVVQYHEARAKHFDFRLEYDGVLVSWAVPKGFSYDPKVKRLAVKVEDHPVDYISFEGVIPKGNYGAGTVQIFDSGTYQPTFDMDYGLKKGHIRFVLFGQKLHGEWSLLKTKDENWLLMKHEDKFAGLDDPKLVAAKNPFKTCSVQLATLVKSIPTGKNWLFEIKYDGYRIVAYGEKGKVKLFTRNGQDYSKKFAFVVKQLEILAQKYTFVLDGEMVAFDADGRSDFSLLQEAIKNGKSNIFFVVFDVLAFQGEDLREKPLLERKKILGNFVSGDNLTVSSFVVGKGKESFALAKKMNLEGIMAKQIDAAYNGRRDETWLKIKCRRRQEFVVAGFAKTEKNPVLSALLLGFFEDKKLIFVGKVGTGFDENMRKFLAEKLEKLKTLKCPFENCPKFSGEKVCFAKPKLVAEIEYAELTKDKVLRQPSFVGLREDKNAKEVKLEMEKQDD